MSLPEESLSQYKNPPEDRNPTRSFSPRISRQTPLILNALVLDLSYHTPDSSCFLPQPPVTCLFTHSLPWTLKNLSVVYPTCSCYILSESTALTHVQNFICVYYYLELISAACTCSALPWICHNNATPSAILNTIFIVSYPTMFNNSSHINISGGIFNHISQSQRRSRSLCEDQFDTLDRCWVRTPRRKSCFVCNARLGRIIR